MKKSFDKETREKILKRYLAGETPQVLSEIYGVGKSTLSAWARARKQLLLQQEQRAAQTTFFDQGTIS